MNEEVRRVIEDNFRLLSLSLREEQASSLRLSRRMGDAEQRLELVEKGLDAVRGQLESTREDFGAMNLELVESAERHARTADSLDEAIELMGQSAVHDAQQSIGLAELEERVAALERWRDAREAS